MSNIGFNFAKPEFGITKCEWIVEAKDQQEATNKLVAYLRELNIQFTHAPTPLPETADSRLVGQELMKRICQITDPIAFIVTLHMFVEYWLDQILTHFFPQRDLTRYDFFKKLEIVYCTDKIPKNLFTNISKLNDLRVKVAHDPSFDLTKMDLNYLDCLPDFQLSQYKPSYDPNAKHNHVRNVLGIVMHVTYGLLHNHCVNTLPSIVRNQTDAQKQQ